MSKKKGKNSNYKTNNAVNVTAEDKKKNKRTTPFFRSSAFEML